jgi:surfeit locus 1 family protein
MTAGDRRTRGPGKGRKLALRLAALLLIVLFAGLGTWQVQRLQWKLALIDRVESRVHAAPAAPPPPARWGQISAASDEYRRVRLAGTFLYQFTTPVQAVSDLGSGYWLLTPLCTVDGYIVLVNRGFVPLEKGGAGKYPANAAEPQAAHHVEQFCKRAMGPGLRRDDGVTGLLRISEPGGGFMRDNDPRRNRWYSRDVQAIATARGLYNVAPYFVDAAKDQDPAGAPDHPVGGLTVIAFHNSHLVYAFTWYALALMVAVAWWWAARGGANREQEDVSRK